MAGPTPDIQLPAVVSEVVATATGSRHRDDPIGRRTGGPAGNARLTAWTGLVLLAAYLVECVTLLSLHQLITVHLLVGAFLLPLVALKTATTGWRIARYYTGHPDYRRAGPPPVVLRMLGPLVVLTGLAVLGSGLALVPLGPESFSPLVTLAGIRISPLTVHQASFVAWLVATGLHVLVRAVSAVQLASGTQPRRRRVPGGRGRLAVLATTVAVGVAIGVLVLRLAGAWTGPDTTRPGEDEGAPPTRISGP